MSAKNYQNRLMCVEVIVCKISVVCLRHSVQNRTHINRLKSTQPLLHSTFTIRLVPGPSTSVPTVHLCQTAPCLSLPPALQLCRPSASTTTAQTISIQNVWKRAPEVCRGAYYMGWRVPVKICPSRFWFVLREIHAFDLTRNGQLADLWLQNTGAAWWH